MIEPTKLMFDIGSDSIKEFVLAETADKALKEISDRLEYLLVNFIETDDGKFTFPDGTTMPCKSKVKYIYTKVGD